MPLKAEASGLMIVITTAPLILNVGVTEQMKVERKTPPDHLFIEEPDSFPEDEECDEGAEHCVDVRDAQTYRDTREHDHP